jgi:hypothetical protein
MMLSDAELDELIRLHTLAAADRNKTAYGRELSAETASALEELKKLRAEPTSRFNIPCLGNGELMAAHEFRSLYAAGCPNHIPLGRLMCPKHWHMLPAPLQARVWETFYAWKAGGRALPYLLAALEAELAVARVEGVDETLVDALAIGVADMERLEMEKQETDKLQNTKEQS